MLGGKNISWMKGVDVCCRVVRHQREQQGTPLITLFAPLPRARGSVYAVAKPFH